MNVVMIIPTGIGCEIGGHAGDGTPAARLLGAVSDKLILHPNVVNASDINEMPENALYVEGSMLDRFLDGNIELKEVRQNKILVAVNSPLHAETINAVSAARSTLGIDAKIIVLNTPLRMIAKMDNGIAFGEVYGWEDLCKQVSDYDFDALAIASLIDLNKEKSNFYFNNGGVNPWGGIEAITTKLISSKLGKPTAHAPILAEYEISDTVWHTLVVDPRMSAEIISNCFLHCVLKGLHKAPRIGKGLSVNDIDVMVSPSGCWGRPHEACRKAGIPILSVKENSTVHGNYTHKDTISVANYLEAAGYITAMKAGVTIESVRRPLLPTVIINNHL